MEDLIGSSSFASPICMCVYIILMIWMENPISTYIHIHFVFVCLFACFHLLNELGHHTSADFHSREILCEWHKISYALVGEMRRQSNGVVWLFLDRSAKRRDVIFCISFELKLWKFEWIEWKSAKNSDRKCSIFIQPFALLLYSDRYCHFCEWPRTTNHKANDCSTQNIDAHP